MRVQPNMHCVQHHRSSNAPAVYCHTPDAGTEYSGPGSSRNGMRLQDVPVWSVKKTDEDVVNKIEQVYKQLEACISFYMDASSHDVHAAHESYFAHHFLCTGLIRYWKKKKRKMPFWTGRWWFWKYGGWPKVTRLCGYRSLCRTVKMCWMYWTSTSVSCASQSMSWKRELWIPAGADWKCE